MTTPTEGKNTMGTSDEMAAELAAVCKKIAGTIMAYQAERGWSERQLLLQFPDIGTSKDWWAVRNGKLDDRDGADLLSRCRSVVAQIEALRDAAAKGEDLYDDMHPVVEMTRAIPALLTTSGNDRVLLIQGEPGSGKTTALNLLRTRLGAAIVPIEASEAWGDSPLALLAAVLRALGVTDLPISAADRLERAKDVMRGSRRVLVIDEAHHLGPRNLNVLKSLVNGTAWGFVLLAIPTLWRKLERGAYEEARQLTTNRLAERIKLECPTARDCQRMLERRVGKIPDMREAAELVVKQAATHGGLGFVRDVCKRLVDVRDAGAEISLRDVGMAVEKELKSR